MGDPKGFLSFQRVTAGKEEVDARLKHYREMYRYLSEAQLKEQASRCMNCGTPFCHGVGCPLGNNIPEFNDKVCRGRWREASDLLHLTNNFPDVTGRVCPALCEASCVVGIIAGAVTVRQIELAIVEKAWQEGWIEPQPPKAETGKRVAVVGSGPAGMAAAQQLRRAGHSVVLYEKANRPGGLLRYGIPDFKLEKLVLDRRFAQMAAEGVDIRCDVAGGEDLAAGYLRKRYDAVCLAIGAGEPRDLGIPGRDLAGIHFAVPYLTRQAMKNAGDELPEDYLSEAADRNVLIIGGGDTSNDCLGTALRQRARNVAQIEIMPEAPADRDAARTPWPMWPLMRRPNTSQEEGGSQRFCVTATRFVGDKGRVAAIECVEVEWAPDPQTGRPAPRPRAGSEFKIDADLVLLAMGFVRPRHAGLLDSLGVEYDPRGNIKTGPSLATSVEGVFAAGDCQSGAWLVVGAIAAGRRMARSVDLYLMGETSLPDAEAPAKLYV